MLYWMENVGWSVVSSLITWKLGLFLSSICQCIFRTWCKYIFQRNFIQNCFSAKICAQEATTKSMHVWVYEYVWFCFVNMLSKNLKNHIFIAQSLPSFIGNYTVGTYKSCFATFGSSFYWISYLRKLHFVLSIVLPFYSVHCICIAYTETKIKGEILSFIFRLIGIRYIALHSALHIRAHQHCISIRF